MWLYFNKQGQLITSLEHGEPARAGTTAFSIYAVFEDVDSSVFDGYATIKLFKPDLHGSSYPILLMKPEVKDFVLQSGEKNDNVLPFKQTDSPYRGFCFDFADFNSTQDKEVLLDTGGLWKAVIVLIGNNLNVQGVATFNVQDGVVSQDGANVNIDLILFEILSEMRNKLNINKGVYVIDEDIEDIPEDTLAGFEDGQLFFNKYDLKMYELEIVEGDPTTYTLHEMNLGYSIEDGTGENALQQKQDGTGGTFDFTNKNPNATALDPTLTGQISYGGVGNYSASFGGKSQASGKRSLAQGTTTVAKGNYSHAEGDNSVALGNDSHAEGQSTVSYGVASHSEGHETQAIGNNAHSEGYQTEGRAAISHSEGVKTIVKDNYIIVNAGETPEPVPTPTPEPSTDEQKDAVNGMGAHAEGHSTYVLGCGSHAEGDTTKAYGRFSHSEGRSTVAGELIKRKTEDGKDYYTPNQNKQFQHAEGESTHAIGHASHTGGLGTVANEDYQNVVGKYNENKQDTLFEVGNGTGPDELRSNAFEVHEDGRITVGASATQDMDAVTLKQMSEILWSHLIVLSPTESEYPYYLLRIVNKRKTAYTSTSEIINDLASSLSVIVFKNNSANSVTQRLTFISYDGTNLVFFDSDGTLTSKQKNAFSLDLVTNY